MSDYKIIIENNEEAFEVTLPKDVVNRIKTISDLNDEDFEGKENEQILNMVLKSLDMVLYGHKHFKNNTSVIDKEENVRAEKKTK